MKRLTAAGSEPQVLSAWRTLPLASWHRPVLLLGATDTGKSTLGRWLYRQLLAQRRPAAYLDLDPGQNDLGPPATLALGLPRESDTQFPPSGPRWLYFLGSNTPRGHLLRQLAGLSLLGRLADQHERTPLLVNTSGFVTAQHGGQASKWALIDLLRPCHVIGLQRKGELEPLLRPLRHLPGVEVIDLPVAPAVGRRDLAARQHLRAQCYFDYFQTARRRPLAYQEVAVFPQPQFTPGQLLALEDDKGLALALGVVDQVDLQQRQLYLRTPWPGTPPISALRLGSLHLNLESGIDRPLPPA